MSKKKKKSKSAKVELSGLRLIKPDQKEQLVAHFASDLAKFADWTSYGSGPYFVEARFGDQWVKLSYDWIMSIRCRNEEYELMA